MNSQEVARSSQSIRSEVSLCTTSSSGIGGDDSFQSLLENTRFKGKEQLSELNSLLATYIDRANQLKAENTHLTVLIKDIETIEKYEGKKNANRFEAERNRVRQALDDARKQAAKYVVERDSAIADHERLVVEVENLEKALKKSKDERLTALSIAEASAAKQRTLQCEINELRAEFEDFEKDSSSLRTLLAALQKKMVDGEVLRTAANLKIQALTEDLESLKNQHKSALREARHKRLIDVTTCAKKTEEELQSKIRIQLGDVRARFQAQFISNKIALKESYQDKIADAHQRTVAAQNDAARLRARIQELEKSGSSRDAVIDGLRREIAALNDVKNAARRSYQERLERKESRIAELNLEIQRMMDEFHELLDAKNQLDTDLNTYRMLIQSEGNRLNISDAGGQSRNNTTLRMTSFTSGGESAQRSTKRARIELDGNGDELDFHRLSQRVSKESKGYQLKKHVDGPVGIEEIDPNGHWVRISNNTDDEVSIAQWKLLVHAGEKEVTYQFNKHMKLDPHGSVTVYSADSGEKHRPPTDLVMKKQRWPIGENPSVRLEDHEGNLRSSVTFEADESSDPSDPAERCSIM